MNATERYLIVNADDFGRSVGVNRGILQAARDGILTSASLMVHYPSAEHAVQYSEHIDLGLHIDLGEWTFRDGQWVLVYERASASDAAAVEREIRRQLEMFSDLTGKSPTHIDSHQHVHLREPVLSIARQIAHEVGAPLRSDSDAIRYCGLFYGQSGKGDPNSDAISVPALLKILTAVPDGVTELACHPGDDSGLNSTYRLERQIEVQTLCDPRILECVLQRRIRLITFQDLAHLDLDLPGSPADSAEVNGAVLEMRKIR
jgi:predicted glycoside hydrolase/deacetylase ChbG (UPF0249 family)